MATAGLNPLIKPNEIKSGMTVDSGSNILLHTLYLNTSSDYIFIQLDASIFFI